MTLRASEEQVERTTGQRTAIQEKYDLELPEHLAYLWGWFGELNSKRTAGMTIDPITWTEIQAWARMLHRRPLQWELRAISGIDAALRNSLSEEK